MTWSPTVYVMIITSQTQHLEPGASLAGSPSVSLTHSRSPENPTPGGQFHKAVIRLFDRYTECAKCGCDRPLLTPQSA